MIALEIIIFLMFFVFSAFFSGIETGMISINRLRLHHLVEDKNDKSAGIIELFLENFDRLFGTTLVGNNICNVAIAIIGVRLGHLLPWGGSEILTEGTTSFLVLIFCEYLPKAWFQSDPIARCRPFAGILWNISLILKPLADLLTGFTNLFFRGLPRFHMREGLLVTREEISVLAKESAEHGNLTPKQRIMIHRVVSLAGKTATRIMIPRDKIVFVDSRATAEDFLRISQSSGFTRLPVYDQERQTFVGIVNLFDVLAYASDHYTKNIGRFMRPAQFLRDTTPLTDVLPRLRRSRQPLALITDAKSQAIGLITTEDILRLIIGTV